MNAQQPRPKGRRKNCYHTQIHIFCKFEDFLFQLRITTEYFFNSNKMKTQKS